MTWFVLKIYNHNYVEYTANQLIVTTSASDLQKLMCLQYYFTCSEPRFVVYSWWLDTKFDGQIALPDGNMLQPSSMFHVYHTVCQQYTNNIPTVMYP